MLLTALLKLVLNNAENAENLSRLTVELVIILKSADQKLMSLRSALKGPIRYHKNSIDE